MAHDIERQRQHLIESLRKNGITDERVLAAVADTPREMFLHETQCKMAYEDRALSIGMGQTISQPLIVATMTQALQLHGNERILEIGTGSGYQTAILARLAYPRFTRFTAGTADELRPMLEIARAQGYAIEREELAFGRACVAAVIRDASGSVVAATSISGPLSVMNLDQREDQLAARVIEMADNVSHRLGMVTVPLSAALDGRVMAYSTR